MKKIILPVLCSVLVLATACKKDDNEPTTESSGPILKTFYFKVDGTAYTGLSSSCQHTSGMIIYQSWDGSQNFGLTLGDSLTPGTYTMGPGLSARMVHTDDNYATSYISDPGTLTIASHDTVNNKISGTFSCTLTRTSPASTKAVTNGEFNIQY